MDKLIKDKDEIREVLERFCFYFDAGQIEEWVDLFAEDGEMLAIGTSQPAEPIRGHNALRAAAKGAQDLPAKSKHFTTQGVIVVDQSRARARSNVLVTVCSAPQKVSIALTGHYEDELVKQHGKWRIQRRVCHIESMGDSLS